MRCARRTQRKLRRPRTLNRILSRFGLPLITHFVFRAQAGIHAPLPINELRRGRFLALSQPYENRGGVTSKSALP